MNRLRTVMVVSLSLFAFLLGRNLSPSDWFPFLYRANEIPLGLVACAAGLVYGGSLGYLCSRASGRAAPIPVAVFVLGCALLLASEAYWTQGELAARLHDVAIFLSALAAITVVLAAPLRRWLDLHHAIARVSFALLAFLVGSQFGIVIMNTDIVGMFRTDASSIATSMGIAVVGASFGLLTATAFAGDATSVRWSVAAYVLGVAVSSFLARTLFMPIPAGPFDYLDWALTTLPPALPPLALFAGLNLLAVRTSALDRVASPV